MSTAGNETVHQGSSQYRDPVVPAPKAPKTPGSIDISSSKTPVDGGPLNIHLELPAADILGKRRDSEEFQSYIQKLKGVWEARTAAARKRLSTDPIFLDESIRSGYLYINVRPFGVSFVFEEAREDGTEPQPKAPTAEVFDRYTLREINVYNGADSGFASCPLKLPHGLALTQQACDVVRKLGEPTRKFGGGFNRIGIGYDIRLSPRVDMEFGTHNWNTPQASILSLTFHSE